jgi:hypothetical protein
VKPPRILVEPGQPDGRVSLRTWPVPLRSERPDVVVQAPRVRGLVLDQVVVRTKGSRVVPQPMSTPVLQRFEQTEFNYDRRGRGDSGDTPPYTVQREVEDLDAVITAAGGSACVWGDSSGRP